MNKHQATNLPLKSELSSAWRLSACAVLLAACALPALAQDKPEQFAKHFAIRTETAAAYYQLNLPLSAHLASANGDLRDARIFNAEGQAVPYAHLPAGTEKQILRQPLRWFPINASAHTPTQEDSNLNLSLRQGPNGTLVEIRAQSRSPGKAKKPENLLRGYVLDASQIQERETIRALELNWGASESDFQLLDIESSDDLQHWRPLSSGVQLARLHYQGARIENRRILLPRFSDPYLRLIWREPRQAPILTNAELEQSSTHTLAPPLLWSEALTASESKDLKPGEYRVTLNPPLPLTRLRIDLPPGNQLLPIEIWVPARERSLWNYIGSSVVYRIKQSGHEWSNTEINLPGDPIKSFVLRIDPRLKQNQAPRLAYALASAQIAFLASGSPPYTLAVGHPDAKNSALPIATLLPGFGKPGSPLIQNAAVMESASPAASSNSPITPEPNWSKIALWAVLLLGVIGMGGMAWSLIRDMRSDNKQKP